MAFINDIVNSNASGFEVDDQIMQINNKPAHLAQEITQIMSQAVIGSDIGFPIKRPKKIKQQAFNEILAVCKRYQLHYKYAMEAVECNFSLSYFRSV